jgi:multiple sugar transport system permease protein
MSIGHRTRERAAGWLFVAPAVGFLAVFLFAPIAMAAWVSLLDWNGQSSPFSGESEFVGLDNYANLLTVDGLLRNDFMVSIRNTFYYVVFGVTGVTMLSFVLALVVNSWALKGRGFFRTVFYFPSITSSVAISVVFLFLFQGSGVVNVVLSWFGVDGPIWFNDPRGVLHVALQAVGVDAPPATLIETRLGGLSLWDWMSGPSVAMCALIALTTWASSGTFMLFFLVGLQDIPVELEEAAAIDGATAWKRFRHLTLPLMRRSIVLVVTLALIGSWQVFDQIYIMSRGEPAKTTLTPAYVSYERSFGDGQFGVGAAVAFVLFAIIIVLTVVQRWIGRERQR